MSGRLQFMRRLVQPPITATVVVSVAGIRPLVPPQTETWLPTSRDLLLQALLHLPRLATAGGNIDVDLAAAEIDRLQARRAAELAPLRSLAAPPPELPSLAELEVRIIDRQAAEPVVAHFHYLRSFREDSINVAALYKRRVVALCSVSPFDLPALARRLPIDSFNEAAVISRVFAFDWAPRNVISFLLARAEDSKALNNHVRMLLTYLNPNLGFNGASYKAANWRHLGLETGTRYAYLHGEYVTDRRLASLSPFERTSIEYSQMRLLPLQVLGRFIEKGRSRAHPKLPPFVVQREPPSEG